VIVTSDKSRGLYYTVDWAYDNILASKCRHRELSEVPIVLKLSCVCLKKARNGSKYIVYIHKTYLRIYYSGDKQISVILYN
jgi:hypothetical protein